jgi:hypothetical protein
LEELAANIKGTDATGKEVSVDPAGLSVTVSRYNGYVSSENDPEFGRRADRMAQISNGPFYAIEMGLSNINTQGGARRNGDCQIVRPDGTPIPRLYGVGEFGSINGYVYVFGNLFEAYTSGHVAGYGAAALDPWDASAVTPPSGGGPDGGPDDAPEDEAPAS